MRYLIALGGNAFEGRAIHNIGKTICRLHAEGHDVIITHGNGPQVGELYLSEGKNLSILTEETQGDIGEEIRHAILYKCAEAKIAIVMTKVLVSARDTEFSNPSKPIGRFYPRESEVPKGRGNFPVRKLEKGYRLVVPSPKPLRIFQIAEIKKLLGRGFVVIAAGGGGAAMVKSGKGFARANAVIDKDLASALLAEKVGADGLFILTDVDGAYKNFDAGDRKQISRMNAVTARKYSAVGFFGTGSMLPKVNACIEFAEKTGKNAAIGNISKIEQVLNYSSATVVTP